VHNSHTHACNVAHRFVGRSEQELRAAFDASFDDSGKLDHFLKNVMALDTDHDGKITYVRALLREIMAFNKKIKKILINR
jgi:hypothetical protein